MKKKHSIVNIMLLQPTSPAVPLSLVSGPPTLPCHLRTTDPAVPTQNRINWPQQLVRGMLRASHSEDAGSAYDELSSMLSTLGDPYTRIIPPR